MKISAQDEYGLRILIRIAKAPAEEGLSLSQISDLERISQPYAAKITRSLRIGGFIQGIRGHKGGYVLALPPDEIRVGQVLRVMGGAMYDEKFCGQHTGLNGLCTNSMDCSLRSLWSILQSNIDRILDQVSIGDLMDKEARVNANLQRVAESLAESE
jgi:Rrf2 family protein